MLKIDHGTMPTTRKSSITSDEYMEIRRQQNKDAQRRWREKRRLEREAGEALTKSIRKKELSPSNGNNNNKIKLPLPPPSLSTTNLTRPRNGSSSTDESIQSPNFTLQPITNTNYSQHHHHHHQRLPPIQPPPSQHIPMMNGVAPPHPAYSPALYPPSPPSRHHQNQQSFYPFDDPTMGERLYHASQQPNFEISKLTWSELIVLACFQPSGQQQQSSSSNRNNEMILPNMNFAKAFIENARCLGLDLGYVTDPNSLSFISRDWQAFQNDHQHQQQQQQNHHQRNLARRRSSLTGNDNSLSIRRRASSNTSSSSSNSSSQRMFNNGNGNSNGFPNGTTLPALSISEHNQFTITSSRLHWDKVPLNLYPTESQLRIDHHPFLDIAFPWPSMREKVLTMLANSIIDEIELIDDCFQSSLSSSLKQNQFAFLIWGNDPSDPFSWEISENFAQKWWFLLDEEIIHRSNWWRKQRNLPPLRRGDRKSSS